MIEIYFGIDEVYRLSNSQFGRTTMGEVRYRWANNRALYASRRVMRVEKMLDGEYQSLLRSRGKKSRFGWLSRQVIELFEKIAHLRESRRSASYYWKNQRNRSAK